MKVDIFKLHNLIVDDYHSYIQSFININDPEIREIVEKELSKGKLWPEPLIQFNPAFEVYGEVPELVDNGVLAKPLSDVFRDDKSGDPYKLYKHQVDAIQLGTAGKDFIVTSGTGYEVDYLPENDRTRYTIHPDARKEILKRLLLLNHERYEEEVKQGLHGKKTKKKKATRKKKMTNAMQQSLP